MRSSALHALRSRFHVAVSRADSAFAFPTPFGVPLAAGRLHEWFMDHGSGCARHAPDAPLCLFADLARRAIRDGHAQRLAWVGIESFPYACHLGHEASRASMVVHARDHDSRLWAADTLLRSCRGVMVFAFARGFTLSDTRRLQLAAGSGGNAGILARPAREFRCLSAAATRWRVRPEPSPGQRPRWTVTLLRNKDRPGIMDEQAAWLVELDDDAGLVHLPAAACDGSPTAARAAS